MTAGRPRYEPFEHTSEAGIIARGATLAEAFANAAEAMYALQVELADVREREERRIELERDNPEDLLVDWLLELVYLTDTEGLVFRRFEVEELSGTRLRARAWGEPFDPERHRSHQALVKAITRHLLEIAPEDGGYRVQVLFDI